MFTIESTGLSWVLLHFCSLWNGAAREEKVLIIGYLHLFVLTLHLFLFYFLAVVIAVTPICAVKEDLLRTLVSN